MKKTSTPSFVLEFALAVQPEEASVMAGRFEAGCRSFNAVLGDELKALDLMRQSKQWQNARALPLKLKVVAKHFLARLVRGHARAVVAAKREPGYPANACLQTPRIYPRGWFRRER